MEYYVGLDVSLKQTSICVVDRAGFRMRASPLTDRLQTSLVFGFTRRHPGHPVPGLESIGIPAAHNAT